MSDTQLRKLERLASAGDLDAKRRLEGAQARLATGPVMWAPARHYRCERFLIHAWAPTIYLWTPVTVKPYGKISSGGGALCSKNLLKRFPNTDPSEFRSLEDWNKDSHYYGYKSPCKGCLKALKLGARALRASHLLPEIERLEREEGIRTWPLHVKALQEES